MRTGALRSMWEFENEGFFTRRQGAHAPLRADHAGRAGRTEPRPQIFSSRGSRWTTSKTHSATSRSAPRTLRPSTQTPAPARSSAPQRDARLNLALYRRAGVLWREGDPDGNPWGLRFMAMFHMANDSGLFRTRGELAQAGWTLEGNRFVTDGQVMLPLYEAKMAYHLQPPERRLRGMPRPGERHTSCRTPSRRAASPTRAIAPLPLYWVARHEVDERLGRGVGSGVVARVAGRHRSTSQRTVIAFRRAPAVRCRAHNAAAASAGYHPALRATVSTRISVLISPSTTRHARRSAACT